MAGYYFQDDVTVLSYDGNTALLTEIGSGKIRVEGKDVENSALKDTWEDGKTTKKVATFEGEIRCSATAGAWFTKVGGQGALVFTSSGPTVNGTFEIMSAEVDLNDAMRWNVSAKSRGTVTVG